jgi:hypothetical protein
MAGNVAVIGEAAGPRGDEGEDHRLPLAPDGRGGGVELVGHDVVQRTVAVHEGDLHRVTDADLEDGILRVGIHVAAVEKGHARLRHVGAQGEAAYRGGGIGPGSQPQGREKSDRARDDCGAHPGAAHGILLRPRDRVAPSRRSRTMERSSRYQAATSRGVQNRANRQPTQCVRREVKTSVASGVCARISDIVVSRSGPFSFITR